MTAVSRTAASDLGWILITGLVALVAVSRVVRHPAVDWPHRMWSQVGWILAMLYEAVPFGGYFIPVVGVAATWRARRPHNPRVDLRFADGGTWEAR